MQDNRLRLLQQALGNPVFFQGRWQRGELRSFHRRQQNRGYPEPLARDLQQDLINRHIILPLVRTESSLRAELRRRGLRDILRGDQMFDTLRDTLATIRERKAS